METAMEAMSFYIDNGESDLFKDSIKEVFKTTTEDTGLFTVDTDGLWEAYLDNISESSRQYYNCHACRHFIQKYGGIVTIGEGGQQISSLWNEKTAPEIFKDSSYEMRKLVESRKIKSLFFAKESVWGLPENDGWTHLHIVPGIRLVSTDRINTPFQLMAESKEEFKMLSSALGDYSVDVIEKASAIINSEIVDRSNQYSKFIADLLELKNDIKTGHATNKKWLAIYNSQKGFAHFKNTMVGTLLDDIKKGLNLDVIKRKFNEKVDSLNFQRPKAFPNEGNIKRADEIVEKLGLENSFKRRFATIEDVKKVWVPRVKEENKSGSVFGGLVKENSLLESTVEKNITLRKFISDIMQNADNIDVFCNGSRKPFCAITTAEDSESTPIYKWDSEEERYPIAWYVYHGGSYSTAWNIEMGWNKITGIVDYPKYSNINGLMFIIENCKDVNNKSLGIFPECLRSELREIRSSVEALSSKNKLSGLENASACGISKANDEPLKVRVVSGGLSVVYNIGIID